MPLLIIFSFIAIGTITNDVSSGGVESFDEAKAKVERGFKDIKPLDYSKLND